MLYIYNICFTISKIRQVSKLFIILTPIIRAASINSRGPSVDVRASNISVRQRYGGITRSSIPVLTAIDAVQLQRTIQVSWLQVASQTFAKCSYVLP